MRNALLVNGKNLVIKIKHIIKGTYNNIFKKEQELSRSRLVKCYLCKDKKYLFGLGFICKHCGCVLKSKTTVKDEKCPAGKW